VARDVLEALMVDRGLRREFDPAVAREARGARDNPPGSGARRDLRDLTTFTIDPTSARDFDDAISAERRSAGEIRVWVHIADVCAFVPEGSLTDREAHRRATSVYVPGAVEPMLPESLSNDACSLVPGHDRLAVTVEMDFQGAQVLRSAFYRSRIRSDARLDYDQVDAIFAGAAEADEPWATALGAAREVSAALGRHRRAAGALEVTSSEPEFRFDDDGHVAEVSVTAQTESHELIEHLMIAANEQVAGLLEDRGRGALFRVHERPDPARVERLLDQLASLEIPTPAAPERLAPSQATELVGEISRRVSEHVRRTGQGSRALTSLVLRSLKQAYYSPQNLGHAGLRSSRYCHFTSPIRRYPDIVCHRALLAAVAGEPEPRADRLEELGSWASAREREAMVIERDADDVARCFALQRELHGRGWREPFAGEVVGLVSAGAFVSFGVGYEGLLPVRRMRGDWWELNEQGTILHGAHTGGTVRLGDRVQVAVDRVQAHLGRVDLVPAEG
jgi:ribonuclease R